MFIYCVTSGNKIKIFNMDFIFKILLITIAMFAITATSLSVHKEDDKTLYRLDRIAEPISYKISLDLKLTLTDNSDLSFEGTTEIEITILKNTSFIKLHSKDLEYGKNPENKAINVTKEDGKTVIELTSVDMPQDDKDFIIINFKDKQTENSVIILTAKYSSKLSDDMHGFYISEYMNEKKEKRYIAATQLEPTHARRVFPCFDEPNFKAKYLIDITAEKGFKTIYSNMAEKPKLVRETNKVQFTVTETMSTYLVAFIVSDFEVKENEDKSYGIIYRDSAKDQINYAYDKGEPLLKAMADYTGVPFDSKTHLVAIPDFSAGAMENWGLVTFREASLLYEEGESTSISKQRIVTVIAHELAHMWFGDLVTLDWWSYTWLNEGFASFFQYYLADIVEPDMDIGQQIVIEKVQNVLLDDALESSKPMTNEDVYTPNEIKDNFGSISYDKGGSVLRMTEHALGKDTFQNGLKGYLKENSWKNTKPDILFAALQKEEDKKKDKIDVAEFMKTWTEQAGYPVINVKLEDKKVVLTQERFYLDKSKADSKWKIPLTYTTDKELDFDSTSPKVWFEVADKTKEIAIDADLIIFNIQQVGFYRVNYDYALLDRLTKYLFGKNYTKIHELNRGQILDDTMNLARAGSITYDKALTLFEYLTNETDFYPWSSAFNTISFMNRRFQGNEDNIKEFQRFTSSLMDKLSKKLGVEEKDTDDHITKLNRVNSLTWGCKFGREDCVKMAETKFKSYMDGTKITPNLRSVVYCTALRKGKQTEWDHLWSQYESTNLASEKVTMLTALGCTTDETILNKYLTKSITADSGIRSQDANYVFTSVYSGNPSGIKIAKDFLDKSYKEIEKMYGGVSELGRCIKGLAKQLTTDAEIKDFKKTLDKIVIDYPTLAELSEEVIAAANTDLEWNKQYEKSIIKHMKGEPDSAPSLANHFILLGLTIMLTIYQFRY